MTRRRLWIVSELFYPEQTSTGYFLSEIARGLVPEWDVHVICGQPTYSERGIKAPSRENWEGVQIYRMCGSRFDKDRLALRLLNIVTYTLSSLLFILIKIRRDDCILIVTNPPTVFPFVGWLARMKRAKRLLLVHDVYPDVLSVTGHLRHRSLLYRLIEKFTVAACLQYDRVVVLGRDMYEKLNSKSEIIAHRLVIIPNWGDTDHVRPCPRSENSFAAAHNMQKSFNVQFSGNIGRTHDVETLIACATATSDTPEIQYWFIGYGGKAVKLRQGGSKTLSNVHLLPRQPREVLGEMLASADIMVIAFVPGMKGLSVPSRMYNVLAAGTAIVAMAEADSELALVVQENDCGWVIPPHDVPALTQLIRHLATPEGRTAAARRGAAARRVACEKYRIDHVLVAYDKLLRNVCEDLA